MVKRHETYQWRAAERGTQHVFVLQRGERSLCLQVMRDNHDWAKRPERPKCPWCLRRLAEPRHEHLEEVP